MADTTTDETAVVPGESKLRHQERSLFIVLSMKGTSMRMHSRLFMLFLSVIILIAAGATPSLAGGATSRVSVSTDEVQGNDGSLGPAISGNGRFVAFTSAATNLVRDDTNGLNDTFVRDRQRGTTTRVSVGQRGEQQDGPSFGHAIARSGRLVAFVSLATNLIPGDTNAKSDVFVRDLGAGTTRRVSLGTGSLQSNGDSGFPAVSADGRFIAFASSASNLVPGDTNGVDDVFVRDRWTDITARVSVGPDGVQGNGASPAPPPPASFPAISADGRFVAFVSLASNLVGGDTNGVADVFVRDRQQGTTRRVSVATDGAQANGANFIPSISDTGRFVAFTSSATNLIASDTNGADDVFVHDLTTGQTRRVSIGPSGRQANGPSVSGVGAVSATGRLVTFTSLANNLVPGDTNGATDVFVRDLRLGWTSRVSVRTNGAQASGPSGGPFNAISASGRHIAFISFASDLVPRDTNDAVDVFVRDMGRRGHR